MQFEEIRQLDYKDRLENMKNRIILEPKRICIERAQLYTESYKKTRGKPPIIRFAKAMEHLLSNMTIKIWENEYIVGNQCSKLVGTPMYPEIRVDTIEQDCDSYQTRQAQKLFIDDKDLQILKDEIMPYWKSEDETLRSRYLSYLKPDESKILGRLLFYVETELTNGIGHFFPGHENVLKYGINGLISKAEQKLKEFSDNTEKQTFLESVLIVCKAVKNFIQRFSNLAREMADNEANDERKKELYEISESCNNISGNTPNTFKEAIQLIYFTHLITGLEDGGFAISIGRLDQYLYSYYLNDLEEKRISNKEVQFLIECFCLKLTTLWNYLLGKVIPGAEGPPIAENLVIGGVDRGGNDATNELSFIILDAYTHLQTVQPTFSVRVHENTPQNLLKKVGESIKSGTSIALFNDEIMINGLVNRGFTLEDAREYAPIGCVEPQHPHKSFGSTNANQFNIVKCFELALNSGVDAFTRKKYGVDTGGITSYEDLWVAFAKQTQYFIKYMVSAMNALDKAIAEINPQPFLSATIDDCIERGLDITNGGAVYDFTGPQAIGLATVADSLAVIKKFVFEENLLPFEELVQMLRNNYRGTFQGKKGKVWRQIFINKAPKFGNDDDFVDQIAADVAELYCNEVVKYKNYRGGKFNPGIYSTSAHLAYGIFTGATADGRKFGEALSNGVGPTNGMDKNGPTAILNSVKKLKNDLMTNGNSLILAFNPKTIKIDNFLALIHTFFGKDGGFHVQFNVVGKETLCDAQQHPENYPGLVVRIAGYSVLFNELSKNAQNDIITRTEY